MKGMLIASQALGQALADKGKQWDEQDAAEALHSSNPDLFKNAGMSEDGWEAMSPKEKAAMVKALPMMYGAQHQTSEDTMLNAKAAAFSWDPPQEAKDAMAAKGYIWAPQGPHGGNWMPASAKPALGSDPTGTGDFYYDGRGVKRNPLTPLPASAATKIQELLANNATRDGTIAQYQAKIDQGDLVNGWDWWHKKDGKVPDTDPDSYAFKIKQERDAQQKNLQLIEQIKANTRVRSVTPATGAMPGYSVPGAGGTAAPVEPALPTGGVGSVPASAPTVMPGYSIPVKAATAAPGATDQYGTSGPPTPPNFAPSGPSTPAAPVADATPAAPAGGGGVPTVKSKADRDALPPGTAYVGPDGKQYVRK